MHVASSVAKNVFNGHSAMKWNDFERWVLRNLDGVQLAYRVSGDVGKMSLKDKVDWTTVLACIDTKVLLARKNPVSIEVRNLVSIITKTHQKFC